MEYGQRKAVVAGHICLDLTPQFTEDSLGQEQFLTPGRLYDMQGINIHTGGAVANTGLAMKFFGADVRLAGKIGRDYFGEVVQEQLREHGAGEEMIVSEEVQTSYSVVLAPPGNDRIFLHQSGANDTFCASDITEELLDGTVLFHFGYPPLMRRLYENDGEELVKLFRRVRERGIVTSLDMASLSENTQAGKADWKGILKRLLPYVDFFLPSAEELAFMLDRKLYLNRLEKAKGRDMITVLDMERDISPLAQEALGYGAGTVMIKCGEKGLYCAAGCGEQFSGIEKRLGVSLPGWAEKRHMEPCFRPDRLLSGTGAGDTSIAAFLCCVLKGTGFERTMQYTSGTGASCVESYDALSGLRTFEELENKIKNGWERL